MSNKMLSIRKYVTFSERILAKLGSPLFPNARVFDLGSGGGNLARSFHDSGYECFGADLYSEGGPQTKFPYLTKIDSLDPYVLPYDDSEFDFAISQNVFEHVEDYDSTLSELSRILKPGAYSLHMFPARYNLIEQHVHVPGGTLFQSYGYLLFWAWFSNLNPKWRNSPRGRQKWSLTAANNRKFLQESTNYLTGREILSKAEKYFSSAEFVDRYLFEFWPGKITGLKPLVDIFPFLLRLHSAFRMRVLLVRK
jgi:ubiquinone/menaquinone biosynthesis C-methylase UbiE